MRLNKKEWDALHEACDFISTNIDGADDGHHEELSTMIVNLNSIIEKHRKEHYRMLVNKEVKKLKANLP